MRPLLVAARTGGAAGRSIRAASTIAGARRGVSATAASRVGGARRATTAAPLRVGVAQSRTFSVGGRRREEAFDPATLERESDEVDVCIVGGGMLFPFACLLA